MWDLPRAGLEPVSPALAGRFSTTVPPGKPKGFTLKEIKGKTHLFKENNKYYCEWYTQIWYERD